MPVVLACGNHLGIGLNLSSHIQMDGKVLNSSKFDKLQSLQGLFPVGKRGSCNFIFWQKEKQVCIFAWWLHLPQVWSPNFAMFWHAWLTTLYRMWGLQGVAVIDAGGGTIDVSTYCVVSSPSLSVEEIVPAECKCICYFYQSAEA